MPTDFADSVLRAMLPIYGGSEGVIALGSGGCISGRPSPRQTSSWWRIMEGSTPGWANFDEHASLEDVFTSRTFGHSMAATMAAAAPVRMTRLARATENPPA